ncbi:MAG: hypothetical protein C0459_00645 [Chitinophaga sp.]|jgi:hypothetical protein|nr:hypothetical protein [Chitinophaga sp.]
MKKVVTLIILFLPFILNAQTSLDEYNYVTKGYKVQIESGLDSKVGYKLSDIGNKRFSLGSVTIKKLIRTTNNSIAAYMIIYTPNSGGSTQYFCIPHPNSSLEVIEKYQNTFWGDEDFLKLKMIFLATNTLIKF